MPKRSNSKKYLAKLKNTGFLMVATLSLVFYTIYNYGEPQSPTAQKEVNTTAQEIHNSKGNTSIKDFQQAKSLLRQFYSHYPQTFYCGCSFIDRSIETHSCDFKTKSYSKRSYHIEWEHIIPASYLGKNLTPWKKGHKNCRNRKGKKFRGRRCARKVSDLYRLMEADMYNLVPAIGEVNQVRGNLPLGLISNKDSIIDGCKTKISSSYVEPRDEVKGFVARTYLYMTTTYQLNTLSNREKKLIQEWNEKYPVSDFEMVRALWIEKKQGNRNYFVYKKAQDEN